MGTCIKRAARFGSIGALLALALGGVAPGLAQETPAAYPERAALSDYMIASETDEIAMARSAAPSSIAQNAGVMVLGKSGYRTVVKETNGFVCMVWRSWSDDLGDEQFWNPKVRAPICMNPASTRTVLPNYLQRTDWVLSGLNRSQMQKRYSAAIFQGKVKLPAPGSMSYMMSRQGYLADGLGHASPHIMFFVPRADRQNWGANAPASPISGAEGDSDPVALFFISVGHWSDGTPAMAH